MALSWMLWRPVLCCPTPRREPRHTGGRLITQPQIFDLRLADGPNRTSVWDAGHLQIMRVRLELGQSLPHHKANAHVVLLPLQGRVRLEVPGQVLEFGRGQAAAVPYDTPMDVSNGGDELVVFLVLKTPHPKTFLQA
ncbi:MAG: hypothetical protein J7M26_02745 [Armatimonadetes bacterium]|nr:hypothetical protein [Armatimonadota bacterium]